MLRVNRGSYVSRFFSHPYILNKSQPAEFDSRTRMYCDNDFTISCSPTGQLLYLDLFLYFYSASGLIFECKNIT